MTLNVAIVGGSGYAGAELLRLLHGHPEFQVTAIAAHTKVGEAITAVHPALTPFAGMTFCEASAAEVKSADVVFLALPHGASAEVVPLVASTQRIVDLGADFRLQDPEQWAAYYGGKHAGSWFYGLPELVDHSALRQQKRVANPGCYATAIALAAAPLIGCADLSDVVVVAASGTSGAGRSASEALLASEIMGSMSAYKVGGVHQHTPEIEQTLRNAGAGEVRMSFTPLLAPMSRGIHATITVKAEHGDAQQFRSAYETFYEDSLFVQVLPPTRQPRTADVLGSNYAHIQTTYDAHAQRVVTTVVIDNLVKGAAGQAIQNANLMCGFAESTGLQALGVAP
jgi:N-acetyl-gamma-glutamyl-phosphate reductase